MNVEKAIEHILQIQAAAEGRVDKAERQIDAIRKLLRTGMKLVVDIGEAQKAGDFKINALIDSGQRTDHRLAKLAEERAASERNFDQSMKELRAAQAATERKLASFIDALKKNKTNGHN